MIFRQTEQYYDHFIHLKKNVLCASKRPENEYLYYNEYHIDRKKFRSTTTLVSIYINYTKTRIVIYIIQIISVVVDAIRTLSRSPRRTSNRTIVVTLRGTTHVPHGVDILLPVVGVGDGQILGTKVKGSDFGGGGIIGGGGGRWLRSYGTRCEENENDYWG